MESLAREKEARLSIERTQASLSEELARAQQELLSSSQKVKQKMLLQFMGLVLLYCSYSSFLVILY